MLPHGAGAVTDRTRRKMPSQRQDLQSATQSNAEIEEVVVLDAGFGLLVPTIGESFIGVRLVDERRLAGEALAARIDAVADQARAFADTRGVVDGFLVVHATALYAQHRP